MRMRVPLVVMVVVVGQLIPLASDAKTIHLKNGKALEGEVESMTDEEITVTISGVGNLTFSRAEVARIDDAVRVEPVEHEGQVFLNGQWMSVEAAQAASVGIASSGKADEPSDYKPRGVLYYGSSEDSLRKSQQELEYAIRHKAPKEEIERLRAVVQANRRNIATNEQRKQEHQARLKAEQQQDEERRRAKATQDKEPGIGELAGGELGGGGSLSSLGQRRPSLSIR